MLKNRANRTQDENERLHSDCSRLSDKVSNLEHLNKSQQTLQDRVNELTEENKELHFHRKRAADLNIELQEEKRKKKVRTEEKRDEVADSKGQQVYRDEFNRTSLISANSEVNADW
jgi:hypothetical protein